MRSIKNWIEELEQNVIVSFSIEEVFNQFPNLQDQTIRNALTRMVKKRKIVSVWNGFYVILPPHAAYHGIVPATYFIDQLMKYLQREYYVGLLNAAQLWGSAHQSPQTFTVIHSLPSIRNKLKKGVQINFINKSTIPIELIEKRNTETGTLNVSSPELTAADLVTFAFEVGSFSRVATVLNELEEVLDFSKCKKTFFEYVSISTIQRLGYILEVELEFEKISNKLYTNALKHNIAMQLIPLSRKNKIKERKINSKWKIIINAQIEIDE